MIHLCHMLKQVLEKIRDLLESGEFERLPKYMSERMMLIERLQESEPDRSRLSETIQLLKYIAKEERLLMELAEEKKTSIQKELSVFQTKKVALNKYHNESHRLYGVQP